MRRCELCEKEFTPSRKVTAQTFCSKRCMLLNRKGRMQIGRGRDKRPAGIREASLLPGEIAGPVKTRGLDYV